MRKSSDHEIARQRNAQPRPRKPRLGAVSRITRHPSPNVGRRLEGDVNYAADHALQCRGIVGPTDRQFGRKTHSEQLGLPATVAQQGRLRLAAHRSAGNRRGPRA
eukprot:scaffold85595_cov57-Phaeocystis_antarctica.AAC.1